MRIHIFLFGLVIGIASLVAVLDRIANLQESDATVSVAAPRGAAYAARKKEHPTNKLSGSEDMTPREANVHAYDVPRLLEIILSMIFGYGIKAFLDKRVLLQHRCEADRRLQEFKKMQVVQIRPYSKVSSSKGIFRNEKHIEIGYQYQLMINNIPCFKPHIIITDSYTEDEVDHEKLKRLIKTATDSAIQAAVGSPVSPLVQRGNPMIIDESTRD